MKFPSSTEVYLAMIPRRSSLVSCFGSGSQSMSSSMIAVVLASINATGFARRAVFMWVPLSGGFLEQPEPNCSTDDLSLPDHRSSRAVSQVQSVSFLSCLSRLSAQGLEQNSAERIARNQK